MVIFIAFGGKKVYVSQFAMELETRQMAGVRKVVLPVFELLHGIFSQWRYIDNILPEIFLKKKFRKQYSFIPYGCEVAGTAGKQSNSG